MNKVLSVIIPMYNSEKFIEKTLNSLLVREELRPCLEVLIINDGSKDSCPDLARGYAEKYPNLFLLINKENGGHGSAINEGVKHCDGLFFRVLDADDWVNTKGLEEVLLYLSDKYGEVDEAKDKLPELILTDYGTYDIQTGVEKLISASFEKKNQDNIVNPVSAEKMAVELDMDLLVSQWNRYKNVCCIHGITYQTAFYRKQGCFLPEKVYYDDAYYFTVPASQAENILYIPEEAYIYRIGDVSQSVSNESRVRRIEQLEKVISSILDTEGQERTSFGMEYWRRKVESCIADYFVTCFLRFSDRKEGRRRAEAYYDGLSALSSESYRRMKKKYRVLKLMSQLGLSEGDFQRLLSMRPSEKG